MNRLAILWALVFALQCVAPAAACLNDDDAAVMEAGYRQSYEPAAYTTPPKRDGSPLVLGSIAVGGILLLGSLGYSLFKRRAPAPVIYEDRPVPLYE